MNDIRSNIWKVFGTAMEAVAALFLFTWTVILLGGATLLFLAPLFTKGG